MPFRYVLSDAWFSSTENMVFIKQQLKRDFILPLKSNRKVALSGENKKRDRYVTLSSLEPDPNVTTLIWLEGVPFALLLVRQVFKNEAGSDGVQYNATPPWLPRKAVGQSSKFFWSPERTRKRHQM